MLSPSRDATRPRPRLRRALAILREDGLGALAQKMVGETVARRVRLMTRDLDPPLPTRRLPSGIRIEPVGREALDALLAFREDISREELAARFDKGDVCFVAWHAERMVAQGWIATTATRVQYLDETFTPGPSEGYLYDAFTDPGWRRRGLNEALTAARMAWLRARGRVRAVRAVEVADRAAMAASVGLGFRPRATIGWWGVGRLRHSFVREVAPQTIPPERWTPRAAWRRAGEVWREEGPRGLGIRLLGESVYRRAWLLERPLDEPAPPIEARLPVAIGPLDPDEIDAYCAFRPETPAAELQRRFRAGDGCFVARHEGRIVCANWWATGSAWNHFLGRTLELEDDEAYVYDSWTLPALRGNALAPALAVALLAHLRAAGYRRVLTVVSPENAANLRARAKSGYRPCGTVGWVGLGPWRRHFRRRRPPRGGPA